MDPPASFSSLPPELVTKICYDSVLEEEDLIALRLTSKSQGIHLSASKEFAHRAFTNNRLLYTRYSLQTFVEICRHPIFGPAVRKIQLSYTRFLPGCFDDEGKRLFEDFYGGSKSESRHRALRDIRLLVKRCDEEEDLRNSGDAENLLAAAFTALSRWHHPLELGMSSDESYTSQDRTYSRHMLGELAHWECDILGTVALLSDAAALSNCVVQGLQIQGAVWGSLLDSPAHSLSALARLTKLELNIYTAKDLEIADVTGLEGMVTKLLKNAVHLRVLHIQCDAADSDSEHLHKLLSVISTMRLESITLKFVDFCWFKSFRNRMECLRHLELQSCGFLNPSLRNVLLSIRKNFPQLEHFSHHNAFRPEAYPAVEFIGVQAVNDGIDKLIQSEAKGSQ